MYKATQESGAFQTRTASKSLRPFATGYNDIAPDRCVVAADCKEQLATLRRNQSALLETMKTLQGADKQRAGSILGDLNRQIGDLARTIEKGARTRFEEIFVQIASKRLPKDAFLQIVEESRTYWRKEGNAIDLPGGDNQKRRKVRNRAIRERTAGWS